MKHAESQSQSKSWGGSVVVEFIVAPQRTWHSLLKRNSAQSQYAPFAQLPPPAGLVGQERSLLAATYCEKDLAARHSFRARGSAADRLDQRRRTSSASWKCDLFLVHNQLLKTKSSACDRAALSDSKASAEQVGTEAVQGVVSWSQQQGGAKDLQAGSGSFCLACPHEQFATGARVLHLFFVVAFAAFLRNEQEHHFVCKLG